MLACCRVCTFVHACVCALLHARMCVRTHNVCVEAQPCTAQLCAHVHAGAHSALSCMQRCAHVHMRACFACSCACTHKHTQCVERECSFQAHLACSY